MPNVIVVDDHALVRKILVRTLSSAKDIHVVGEASNGNEAMEIANSTPADIMLLDVSIPGPSGVPLVELLRTRHPSMQILMLSMHSGEQLVASLLQAGAIGYATKGSDVKELITAIRFAAEGRPYSPSACT